MCSHPSIHSLSKHLCTNFSMSGNLAVNEESATENPCECVPRGVSRITKSKSFGHSIMSDSATPWTVAHQAPLSVGFPRQEYWSGCHFLLQASPPPRD